MDYYSELHEKLSNISTQYNFEKIKRAFDYANEMHAGQFRKSGEAYISHPVAVALIVAQLELDTDSICAALLHDTLEDCKEKTDCATIKKLFGEEVLELVDGLTKLVDIHFENREEESVENLRKMFLAMSKDIRVIFIKLADRLHNMRTLSAQPDAKQRSIALETMHVYAPLAHRLGIQKIKGELENLALGYLDPIGYAEVKNDIEHRYGENRDFLENAQQLITEKLNSEKISYSMTGRVKSIFSIYKKMYNQGKSFDEIYDFYAIRIIVDTELECYTVLGIIHEMFNLIPGRFKDYISTPKPNLYRSLHTTVIGRHGIPFEVQIRTWEMHTVAEYGVAAHWKYKSGEQDKENIAEKLKWIRTLVETEKGDADNEEFLKPLKIDVFEDEIFVFTPKGDVISLQSGSTAIDFAFAIHSEVGNRMTGAKVNGMIVPIDTVLQTGQIVEVITSSSPKGPNKDWLKIVRTSEAKNKIRQWYKRERRTENIVEGKNIIEKELKSYGRQYTDVQKAEIVGNVSSRIGMASVDDFYNSLGYGGLSISKVSGKLRDEFVKVVMPEGEDKLPEIPTVPNPETIKKQSGNLHQSVIVDGIDNCHIRFAKCCNPLPGDKIIGFVTRGFGVSVHKKDCPNAVLGYEKGEEKDRWVEVHWSQYTINRSNQENGFETVLQIYAHNSITVIADLSNLFNDLKVQVNSLNSKVIQSKKMLQITVNISCKNTSHVTSILQRIRKLNEVTDVTRGFS
ncbi:MAG: bifunctional (p)ppGpp synthetase/guanosine-3',5'-bis(diphosphate) 3'-pyrophosphohydrolase [Ruminococcaceae bacterium]|nr:bifunctional (p)ppGpp synthetase/guanosine-3',5'-bis(diphosphate) 3'-pyrophosphohydrolase [Oscillospiraceae bacterium]